MPTIRPPRETREHDFTSLVVVPRGMQRDMLLGMMEGQHPLVQRPPSCTPYFNVDDCTWYLLGMSIVPLEPCEMFMATATIEVGHKPWRLSWAPPTRTFQKPIVVPVRQSLQVFVGWQGQRRDELPLHVVLHCMFERAP